MRLIVLLDCLLEIAVDVQSRCAVGGAAFVSKTGNNFMSFLSQHLRRQFEAHLFVGAVMNGVTDRRCETEKDPSKDRDGHRRTKSLRFSGGSYHLRRRRFPGC